MPLLKDEESAFCRAVSQLVYCNPFLEERVALERQILGPGYVDRGSVWHPVSPRHEQDPNVLEISQRVEEMADSLRRRYADASRIDAEEARLYRDLVLYLLYSRYQDAFFRLGTDARLASQTVHFYDEFLQDFLHYLDLPGVETSPSWEAPHLFACFFQVRRAFHLVFRQIVGASMPTARLRAAVWESIFTHDMRRYRRSLFATMGDVTTLITGQSGTGKELVAQAIGLSRYIPFDPRRKRFTDDFESSFYPLNLSALSATLIESELFGHRRGAFTGAVADRVGWLELCPPLGSVFLDEIGEVDASIQVKLLRVLQTRVFQRLGETKDRRFQGKIIAATNRDLTAEMRAGRLRQDFYYRLCSDRVRTPSLEEQLRDAPEELRHLLLFLTHRMVGEEEAEALTDDVQTWIEEHLGSEYRWPGNVRELEQCVRNVMIRGEYHPESAVSGSLERFLQPIAEGRLSAEELLRRYTTLVYLKSGSYQEAARRLGLDRRTVKAKVDEELLGELRSGD